jgi:hypothetical protein
VQNHVHDRDDVGEGLLFLPVEGALLQGAVLGGGALGVLGAEVVEGFAEEAGRADGGVADGLAEPGRGDGDDGANERARGVAALDAVLYLAEDFADLVFDGVRAGGLGLEAVQVGEELAVDELDEVVAGLRGVVVDATCLP